MYFYCISNAPLYKETNSNLACLVGDFRVWDSVKVVLNLKVKLIIKFKDTILSNHLEINDKKYSPKKTNKNNVLSTLFLKKNFVTTFMTF